MPRFIKKLYGLTEVATTDPNEGKVVVTSGVDFSKEKKQENIKEGMFSLKALADTNAIRRETLNEKSHIVIPVIALVEGVFQAGNIPFPELMTANAMMETLESWNGRAIVVDHPSKEGFLISANSPEVHDQEVIGNIFNAAGKKRGTKLFLEAWIDEEKVKRLGGKFSKAIKRLEAGEEVEVSTGFMARSFFLEGSFEGKDFERVISHIEPDHLALLSEGSKGAFSWETGAGAPRLNTKQTNLGGDEEEKESTIKKIFNEVWNMFKNKKGKEIEKKVAIEALMSGDKPAFGKDQKEWLEGLKDEQLQSILTLHSVGESEEEIAEVLKAAKVKEDKEVAEAKALAAKKEEEKEEDHKSLSANEKDLEKETKPMSFDSFMAGAPKEFQETVRIGLEEHKAKKDSFISALNQSEQCKFSEEELKGMDMKMLDNLAAMIVPPNYSGAPGSYFNRDVAEAQVADEPPPLDFSKQQN
ncbi:hypothetical protein LCGC14_0681300 [marine sediment metagenome]|uniref:Uncharacterized protein n=1 Tax=marine sediment metagenome TaxID=412755 RepID=A0A0F9QN57_9ZZZZ